MTVKVAGVWELGWSTPITELDQWLLLRDFKVDEFCMSPVSGISSGKVKEFATTADVIIANPDLTPIYVDENGQNSLGNFMHPDNCLYIFGKAGHSPWVAAGKSKDSSLSLRIETPSNSGLLWPHQAAGIVFYDRFMKS